MTVVRRDNIKLFFDRVLPEPNTGCWLWLGGYTTFGYGRLTPEYFNGFATTHRFSYFLANGEFDRKMCVCHKCDVPECVNPDHLFLGTNDQNMADMVSKKRSPIGENNPKSKVTLDQVLELRSLYKIGVSRIELASKFGLSKTQTAAIINEKSWNLQR